MLSTTQLLSGNEQDNETLGEKFCFPLWYLSLVLACYVINARESLGGKQEGGCEEEVIEKNWTEGK